MVKLDLYKELKAEYVTPKQPAVVETTRAKYLAIGGEGVSGESRARLSSPIATGREHDLLHLRIGQGPLEQLVPHPLCGRMDGGAIPGT